MEDSPGKRLAAFRKSLAISQRQLGVNLSVSGGLIGQIEADITEPSRSILQKLADTYGVSADWLLSGQGEMLRPVSGFSAGVHRIKPPEGGRPLAGDLRVNDAAMAIIKRYDLSVSAGNGLVPVDEMGTDSFAFPVEWLNRIGVVGDLAALVTVSGDSMAPTIPDGALVLIDARRKSVDKPGVYAFTFDGEVYIKRLVASQDARVVTLISDNPSYPPRSISGPELGQLRIAGKVCIVLHEV